MTASSRNLRIQMFRACMAAAVLLFLAGIAWGSPAGPAAGAAQPSAMVVSIGFAP